jgi:hypothetical protein
VIFWIFFGDFFHQKVEFGTKYSFQFFFPSIWQNFATQKKLVQSSKGEFCHFLTKSNHQKILGSKLCENKLDCALFLMIGSVKHVSISEWSMAESAFS